MSLPDHRHQPRAAFVEGLEREVLRAYHAAARESAVPHVRPLRRRERFRMAAMLVVGLLGGVGAQLASAQVQGARSRGELERSIEVDREVQSYRLSVAQAEVQRVRTAFEAGAVSHEGVMAAEAELRAMQVAMARLQLDLAEVRLSNTAPRNEVWAPLVSGRDFVKERLRLSAAQAQDAVRAAEAHLELVRRRSQLGAASATEVTEAQLRLAEHNRQLRRVVLELRIRDEFLTQRLSPEETTRRVQRGVMDIEIAGAQQHLEIARERVQLVRQRVTAGLMNEVELKRAELDVLEREVLLQRMMTELQRMDRPEE